MNTAAPSTVTSHPRRLLARITLQLTAPMHIGTGREQDGSDAGFVLDANGLPAIPGSSTAGLLRFALPRFGWQEPDIDSLFGYQKPTGPDGEADGRGSRLNLSWGYLHDSQNHIIHGLLADPGVKDTDVVLKQASRPLLRDRVALHQGGAARYRGKFDQLIVTCGHRFTMELELLARPRDPKATGEGLQTDDQLFDTLLQAFEHPLTRFGGHSGIGFGAFEVIRVLRREFDLSTIGGLLGRADLDLDLNQTDGWQDPRALAEAAADSRSATATSQPASLSAKSWHLHLKADTFWRIGSGSDPAADLSPLLEPVIVWKKEGEKEMATSVPHLVIPGSSLRGPLRHRMLFHACRRAGYSLDRADPTALGLAEQWVRALFGSDPAERDLILGRLSLSEVYLPLTFAAEEPPAALPEPMVQHHMGGDRFTGGVLGSALFNEKPLYQDAFTLTIQDQGDPTNAAAPEALACLELTLDDLRYGRLPLGSGAGRGNGRFLGPDRPDPSPRSTPSTPPSPVS